MVLPQMNKPSPDPYQDYEAPTSEPQAVNRAPFDESNFWSNGLRFAESLGPTPAYDVDDGAEVEIGENYADICKPGEDDNGVRPDDEEWMHWIDGCGSTRKMNEQISQDTLGSTHNPVLVEMPQWPSPLKTTRSGTSPSFSSLPVTLLPEPTPSSLLSSMSSPNSQKLEPSPNPFSPLGDPSLHFNTTNEFFSSSPLQSSIDLGEYNYAINSSVEGTMDLERPTLPEGDSCPMQWDSPRIFASSASSAPSRTDHCPPCAAETAEYYCQSSSSSIGSPLAFRPPILTKNDEGIHLMSPLAKMLQVQGDLEQNSTSSRIDFRHDGFQRQRSWSCRDIQLFAELETMKDPAKSLLMQGQHPQLSMPPPEINVPLAEILQQSTLTPRLERASLGGDASLLSPYSATPYSPFLGPENNHGSIRFHTRSISNPNSPDATATTSPRIDAMRSPPSPSPSVSSVRSLDSALQCPQCFKDISNSKKDKDRKSNLRRHMRVKHGNGPKPTCPEPGCGKVFERSDALAKHKKNHHRL